MAKKAKSSAVTRSWKVGVDVGGTFTDVVAVDTPAGEVRTAKLLTTPLDPVGGIEAACRAVDLDLAEVHDVVLGTTMATNAIVEGRLAKTALVTTEGFADTLDIGRQNRRELYRMEVTPRPESLVPRELRFEVTERLDAEGREVIALDEEEIARLCEAVEAIGAEAAAVCLLHSYVDGAHERRLGEVLRRHTPFIALSHELNPEPREFERMNSTILNAALMPVVSRYLRRMEERLGTDTGLHVFHSAGGMAAAASVEARPLSMALSGPAAGVAAAARLACKLQLPAAIAFDMGGTTTDVSIVVDGKARIGSNHRLAGYPIRQMMVGVESIGAGGGSIARVEHGAIRVGPESAGASPGPACYGLGGDRPTVTDANLLLGYLDTERPLGGTVRLDVERARAAVSAIAEAFAIPLHEAALGIHRVANANMARALRRVTVECGVDARECTLLAFGGAGPMHAVALARDFGIGRVVVPRHSSVFSALGCLVADMRYAEQRSLRMANGGWDPVRLLAIVEAMTDRLAAPLVKAGHDRARLKVEIEGLIRYREQSDTVEVSLAPPFDPCRIGFDFKSTHRRLYGFATDEPWELDTLRVAVSATNAATLEGRARSGTDSRAKAPRAARCWFEGIGNVETRFRHRDDLAPGQHIEGPAVIEDAWSTVVVPPGAVCWSDEHRNLQIDTREATP
jgi:N-methylhydantoinase A